MIIFNHHTKVLNHRKFIFFSHCDTLLDSLAIVHERCKSSCFILPFSTDWSQNLRVFVPWNACLLTYVACFGQDINRLPCFYCFFIVLFRIICLIIQEKLLAWSLFDNHFDFPWFRFSWRHDGQAHGPRDPYRKHCEVQASASKRKQAQASASKRKQAQASASKCKPVQASVSQCELAQASARPPNPSGASPWVCICITVFHACVNQPYERSHKNLLHNGLFKPVLWSN